MIKKVQVLWYLNKEDLENYCIDFKEYKSHKLEGYEIVDVDEDLIYDLCDRDPDRLEPLGYFKNIKELENYLSDTITNNEYELELDSLNSRPKYKRQLIQLNSMVRIITFQSVKVSDVTTPESPAGMMHLERNITVHQRIMCGC